MEILEIQELENSTPVELVADVARVVPTVPGNEAGYTRTIDTKHGPSRYIDMTLTDGEATIRMIWWQPTVTLDKVEGATVKVGDGALLRRETRNGKESFYIEARNGQVKRTVRVNPEPQPEPAPAPVEEPIETLMKEQDAAKKKRGRPRKNPEPTATATPEPASKPSATEDVEIVAEPAKVVREEYDHEPIEIRNGKVSLETCEAVIRRIARVVEPICGDNAQAKAAIIDTVLIAVTQGRVS